MLKSSEKNVVSFGVFLSLFSVRSVFAIYVDQRLLSIVNLVLVSSLPRCLKKKGTRRAATGQNSELHRCSALTLSGALLCREPERVRTWSCTVSSFSFPAAHAQVVTAPHWPAAPPPAPFPGHKYPQPQHLSMCADIQRTLFEFAFICRHLQQNTIRIPAKF